MRIALAPPPGLVSDETTFSSPGTWADGNNVRFYRGRPQTIGGWVRAHLLPLTGVCRNALSWIDTTSQLNIAFGTHSKLFVLKGGVLADITPVGLTPGNIDRSELGYGQGGYGIGGYGGGPNSEFFPRTWSFATFGQYLMAAPRGKTLYVWQNNTANKATIVAQAPDHIGSMLTTPERVVMAFGCEEELSGDYNPMCIRWSDIEDYATWATAAGNSAGEYILEGGGRIVAARLLGSYIGIWTDTSVFLGQYVGSDTQVYRFDLVADNCGLASPNAVTVVNQVCYWMTPDLQFYAWQVGAPPSPIVCPIQRDFSENLVTDQIDKVISTGVSVFGEVWWWYPDGRDGLENSRYLSLTLADGSWSKGDVARTAAIDSGPQQYPVFVASDGTIYYHENGASADDAPLDWFLRSSDQYIDQGQRRVLIRGIWPDFEAQRGDIALSIYYRARPQAPERVKGPYALTAGRSKKDFLVDARIAAVEFSGASMPSFMRGGLPSFDVVVTGEQ